jgi:hypothetical protein
VSTGFTCSFIACRADGTSACIVMMCHGLHWHNSFLDNVPLQLPCCSHSLLHGCQTAQHGAKHNSVKAPVCRARVFSVSTYGQYSANVGSSTCRVVWGAGIEGIVRLANLSSCALPHDVHGYYVWLSRVDMCAEQLHYFKEMLMRAFETLFVA